MFSSGLLVGPDGDEVSRLFPDFGLNKSDTLRRLDFLVSNVSETGVVVVLKLLLGVLGRKSEDELRSAVDSVSAQSLRSMLSWEMLALVFKRVLSASSLLRFVRRIIPFGVAMKGLFGGSVTSGRDLKELFMPRLIALAAKAFLPSTGARMKSLRTRS